MNNYEEFERLCKLNSVTPYKVSKETGVSRASLSAWKLGDYKPKRDKLQKIADFFHVDVSTFYEDEMNELSKELKEYNKKIEKEYAAFTQFIDKNKDFSFIMDEYEKGSLERKKYIEQNLAMLAIFLKNEDRED